jgi:sugar/nucleoside kinase (ribokinase family)
MAINPVDKKVMVAGHICLDIAPKFAASGCELANVLVPGKLVNVNEAVLCTGGAVSNTGLAMAKLGADVILNGKVGDDEFGKIIKNLVGIERASAFKTVKGQNTSYTIVLALPGVDRIFLHYPGTNDTFGAEDIDYEAAKKCLLFHFGYPPLMKRMYADDGRELIEMFKSVKSLGVTTSLDMALPDPNSDSGKAPWRVILEKLLPYVDIFVPSIEEVAFMLDKELFATRKFEAGLSDPVHKYKSKDYSKISDQLISMGAKIIAIKSGIRGYYLRTGHIETIGSASLSDIKAWQYRQLWAASFKAEQFGSATGAGDATIAGFLCALMRGYSPEEALRIANIVGWENIRAIDALSGIEDWDATIQYVKDITRPQNPTGLDSSWRYSETECIYYGPQDRRKSLAE